jgi:hypothetical protein
MFAIVMRSPDFAKSMLVDYSAGCHIAHHPGNLS